MQQGVILGHTSEVSLEILGDSHERGQGIVSKVVEVFDGVSDLDSSQALE
jgi:hypothetical protein